MGRGDYLGEFEQIVLLAVARLDADGYGMRIRREIEARTSRNVSIGGVYATLDRLEAKGLITSRDDESGGRARRFFSLTRAAVDSLEASRRMQASMWDGLELRGEGRRS